MPTVPTIEEIVDEYVQRARSSMRPTEYERVDRAGIAMHRITENDQFRILHHVIAVNGKSVAWIWRNQDFWPTDQLTDITTVGADLTTIGVIHNGAAIQGVKFTLSPRRAAGNDPDYCLPFVSNFTHVEVMYRLNDNGMELDRARMGVDFATKVGRTILARAVRNDSAALRNCGFDYRSSLGSRLLVRVTGADEISVNLPTSLTSREVADLYDHVTEPVSQYDGSFPKSLFLVERD